MKPFRTRFAKDIVAEFLPPENPSKKVIIFLSGMPSVPKLRETLQFYAKKGFWVFHIRYRGSWESDGSFLQYSPEKDVIDVINQLPKGFVNFATEKMLKVNPTALYLFGCSFGGPAALLTSFDKRVTKVVTLSSVIDWKSPSKAEPLDWLFSYIQKAYGNAYRLTKSNWEKLSSGNFYNPIAHTEKIDGKKILMFHAKDDQSVDWKPAVIFAKETQSRLILSKSGGHCSSSYFSHPKFYKEIKKFLNKK